MSCDDYYDSYPVDAETAKEDATVEFTRELDWRILKDRKHLTHDEILRSALRRVIFYFHDEDKIDSARNIIEQAIKDFK